MFYVQKKEKVMLYVERSESICCLAAVEKRLVFKCDVERL